MPGAPDKICVVGREGGSPKVLYQGTSITRTSWGRDGTSVVFGESTDLIEDAQVKLLDLKTGQVTTLPDSKGVVMPVVSPDGHYLGGGTADGKHLKIYDFDARTWKELSPEHTVGFTEWSADGRYLYFDNGWSADPAIYRLRVADQKVGQILTLKKFRRVLWGYLPWFGLTPKSEVLLMRDVGSQEVYALDFDSHD